MHRYFTAPSGYRLHWLLLSVLFFSAGFQLQSCSKTDKKGLDFARSIGEQASALLPKAGTDAYSRNSQAITQLKSTVDAACEHAAGRKGGKELSAAWKTLRDGLIFPFLQTWERDKMVSPALAGETLKQVQGSLDAIINAYKSNNTKA